MRSVLRALVAALVLAFASSAVAFAAAINPNTLMFNPQPEPPGIPLVGGGWLLMTPQHQIFLVSKAGMPGKLAPPGKYNLTNGGIIVVGGRGTATTHVDKYGKSNALIDKNGVVQHGGLTLFPDVSKFPGTAHYYDFGH